MYTEDGDTITLTLNRADYDFLLFMLGAAAGRVSQGAGGTGGLMYTEDGDTITLTLNRADYDFLLFMLGAAAGRASQDRDKAMFWQCLEFTNRLLAGNPRFRPYQIPEQYKADADLPRTGA